MHCKLLRHFSPAEMGSPRLAPAMPTHQPRLPKPLLPLTTSRAMSSAPPFPILPPTPCSTTLFFVFICSQRSCNLHPGQHQAPWGATTPTRSTQPQPSHPQPSPSCLLPSPQNHKLQLWRCWTAPNFAASSPCCHPSDGSEAGGTHPARVWQPAGAPPQGRTTSAGAAGPASRAKHLPMPKAKLASRLPPLHPTPVPFSKHGP